MKIRGTHEAEKIEAQMAPMIDVVFLLLIFFMLTLKIIPAEGDFNINMPVAQAGEAMEQDITLDIKIRLTANPDGSLEAVQLGRRNLGNDELVFDRLNSEVIALVGRPGSNFSDDMEVEIDADYNLDYRYVIKAISAATGKIDPITKQPVRYVDKIKFAPPRRPNEG